METLVYFQTRQGTFCRIRESCQLCVLVLDFVLTVSGHPAKPTFCPNADQPHPFTLDVIQGLLHVGDLVHPHLSLLRLRESLPGDHLQEVDQLQPIAEVFANILDLRS